MSESEGINSHNFPKPQETCLAWILCQNEDFKMMVKQNHIKEKSHDTKKFDARLIKTVNILGQNELN